MNNSEVIDDQLPFHPIDKRLVCMTVLPSSPSSADGQFAPDTIWPSLLEKAVSLSQIFKRFYLRSR